MELRHVILYQISNLLLLFKIKDTCVKNSKECSSAKTLDKLSELLKTNQALIICDLVSVKSELPVIIKIAKEYNSKIFGYYSHVDKETEALARSVGADYIVPRSALQSKLRSVLVQTE